MKNQEKIAKMKKGLEASGIYEALRIRQQLFEKYLQLEDQQKHRKEIGFAFLKVVDAIWQLEATLENIIIESKNPIEIGWKEKKSRTDKDNNCW